MKFDGTVLIQAPLERVWSSLIDPNLVSQCAPGLQSMEIVVPDEKFKVVASIGFGAVKMTFNVDVVFVEKKPPTYARISAHGKAPGGAVDVASEMSLTSQSENETQMAWSADVAVIGSIAGLANRLMGGMTKQLSGQFFKCFKEKVEQAKVPAS